MNKFFLIVHLLAAIICVGPVTVAASMFPPIARRMLTAETPQSSGLDVLHRITRVYAWAGLAVPVFGFALAGGMHVMGEAWLIISIVLTLAAALVLAFLVVPAQSAVLAVAGGTAEARSGMLSKAKLLSMTSGIFGLLWLIVLVLMVVKPGHHRG
jgi:uncharacterized membrane protein